MHDTLQYLHHEPIHRKYHHNEITFSILYAWSENFLLPLSHDEVVHGKGALVNKFPGDRWQKLATLRALYGYMWAHPGKKLLFMGGEFAHNDEWSESDGLDWYLTQFAEHNEVQTLITELNSLYKKYPALYERDTSSDGFHWLIGDDGDGNTLAFSRVSDSDEPLICITNFSPVPHEAYRLPIPVEGDWHEILNTDDLRFGGSGVTNTSIAVLHEENRGYSRSAVIRIPPLGTVWLARRI